MPCRPHFDFPRSILLVIAYFALISAPVRVATSSKRLGLSPLRSINFPNLFLTSIMSHDASQKLESSSNDDQPHEPLMITDAPADSSDQDTKGHSIAVGGEGVQLDHLGPMVINSDGTISRISNWDKLTEPEKSRTIRLVTQRNAMRVQKLKDQPPKTDEQPATSTQDPTQHGEL